MISVSENKPGGMGIQGKAIPSQPLPDQEINRDNLQSVATESSWKDSSLEEVATSYQALTSRGKAICRRRGMAEAEAEDIAEDAFLRLRRLEIPTRDPRFAPTYFKIIGGKCADLYRRLDVRAKHEPVVQMEYEQREYATNAAVGNGGLAEVIHKAIDKLTAKQKQAVTLHFFENRPLQEIAGVMAQSENTIKAHLHRAKVKLRQELEGMELV